MLVLLVVSSLIITLSDATQCKKSPDLIDLETFTYNYKTGELAQKDKNCITRAKTPLPPIPVLRSRLSKLPEAAFKNLPQFYKLDELIKKPRHRVYQGEIRQCLGPSDTLCTITLITEEKKEICTNNYHVTDGSLHCIGKHPIKMIKPPKKNPGCSWVHGPLLLIFDKDYNKLCRPFFSNKRIETCQIQK